METRWTKCVRFLTARVGALDSRSIDRLQRGLDPDDWKPMKTIGAGVREVRIREASGAYRLIYVATFEDAIYVLHAFQKKTQTTSKRDLDLASTRFRELMRRHKR